MLVFDLFCGAGGASMGLHQAWPKARIVGVDIVHQPNYPSKFRFVLADALDFIASAVVPMPDFIWASPPCQSYSYTSTINNLDTLAKYPRLIAKVRELITTHYPGVPYCIENVPGAPLKPYIQLCGTMFPELNVYRHRWFECNFPIVPPTHIPHPNRLATQRVTFFNGQGGRVSVVGHQFSLHVGSRAMNIRWMNREELAEAVPPAYSRYIAQQLRKD